MASMTSREPMRLNQPRDILQVSSSNERSRRDADLLSREPQASNADIFDVTRNVRHGSSARSFTIIETSSVQTIDSNILDDVSHVRLIPPDGDADNSRRQPALVGTDPHPGSLWFPSELFERDDSTPAPVPQQQAQHEAGKTASRRRQQIRQNVHQRWYRVLERLRGLTSQLKERLASYRRSKLPFDLPPGFTLEYDPREELVEEANAGRTRGSRIQRLRAAVSRSNRSHFFDV